MEEITLKELALPLIKAIDSFNYLLKSHHRRVAVIAYNIAKELNLSHDPKFLENLNILLDFGFNKQLEIQIKQNNYLLNW